MTKSVELIEHEFSLPATDGLTVTVGAPAGWHTQLTSEPDSFLANLDGEEAGPFGDNLIVTVERLTEEAPTDLEELQGLFLIQAHDATPDLHVIDDREIEVAGDRGWFRASLQTAPAPTEMTVVSRQIFTVREGFVVSLVLTSMSFRDSLASAQFRAIVDSVQIRVPEEDR
ncbi:MAG TPA: hypothetical protein H9837_05865 [Candidatus Brachybacterium merdigallinarum]|nr:hypothetical protein [Candidatus Brachybacterium merdigallinarum]